MCTYQQHAKLYYRKSKGFFLGSQFILLWGALLLAKFVLNVVPWKIGYQADVVVSPSSTTRVLTLNDIRYLNAVFLSYYF